jgi:hypothetical protein
MKSCRWRSASLTSGRNLLYRGIRRLSAVRLEPRIRTLMECVLRAPGAYGRTSGEYLAKHAGSVPSGPLRITPASHGSGETTASSEHDRFLAE